MQEYDYYKLQFFKFLEELLEFFEPGTSIFLVSTKTCTIPRLHHFSFDHHKHHYENFVKNVVSKFRSWYPSHITNNFLKNHIPKNFP